MREDKGGGRVKYIDHISCVEEIRLISVFLEELSIARTLGSCSYIHTLLSAGLYLGRYEHTFPETRWIPTLAQVLVLLARAYPT
jgi:hypothetical protein